MFPLNFKTYFIKSFYCTPPFLLACLHRLCRRRHFLRRLHCRRLMRRLRRRRRRHPLMRWLHCRLLRRLHRRRHPLMRRLQRLRRRHPLMWRLRRHCRRRRRRCPLMRRYYVYSYHNAETLLCFF